MSDTVRTLGAENDIAVEQLLPPTAIQDTTPVVSSALDLRSHPRMRPMLIVTSKEVTATAHTIDFQIKESATSGGSYATSTSSGTITGLSADGCQSASIRFNPAKPFIKLTATGSHTDIDVIVSAVVIFIGDSV